VDAELERRTLRAENDLWWYRGRRAIVLDAVRRLRAGVAGEPRFLDAGCGGGAVLAELAKLGTAVGIEPSPVSRQVALERGVAPVLDARLEAIPAERESFEIGLALDVLEHIDDDRAALRELRRVVSRAGGIVVTVPAHPRLWSRHDELNEHRRRYTARTLRAAAESSGWQVGRITHFNLLLLPGALLRYRFGAGDGLDIPPAPINRSLEGALQLERLLIRAGLRLPAGLSLLAELH
jgi:SAM-dependent methyltransferase